MNKAAVLALVSFVLLEPALEGSHPSAKQKPMAEQPTLEQILDRYVQSLGGKAAIEKINTRASRGAFTSAKLKAKGTVELYAKAPNKQLMVLAAEDFGSYKRGFNGTVAWEKYPGDPDAANVPGFAKRDAEFYLPLKFLETFPRIALKGATKLGDREVYVLEAPAAGNPKRWYFDRQSGLLVRA